MRWFSSHSTGLARRGFTLIETAMATIIVGVGIVSTMSLFSMCTVQNRAGGQMTAAMMLAGNIQEAMANLTFSDPVTGRTTFGPETGESLATYNDIDDFEGLTFSPPIDSLRNQITELSNYSQIISVVPVYPSQISSNTNDASPAIPETTYTGACRVRVRVLYRSNVSDPWTEIYRYSWIRVDR